MDRCSDGGMTPINEYALNTKAAGALLGRWVGYLLPTSRQIVVWKAFYDSPTRASPESLRVRMNLPRSVK
jgi:hypothetical protein